MKTLSIILIGLSSFSVTAQYKAEEFEAALLQAKYGAMLVYNGQKNSFSLRFISKAVVPTNEPNFLRVDNILMQSSIIPFTEKVDFNNLNDDAQRSFLAGWKNYEKEWVQEQLKTEINDASEFMKIAERSFLYWTYDMPKGDDPNAVVKQVYLVAICFDQILILNGPVEKGKTESAVKEKLISVAQTLKINPGQVQDIEKLYKDLMK
ncbi:MAG TPA: hypothetical protein VL443_09680 [Cyclobacteriaceae bacterium]|jgi:hypothetical protein|nr:hypothetical protein [Cyclobacteriaceae bacterium]